MVVPSPDERVMSVRFWLRVPFNKRKHMNAAHKLGMKRNRLSRLNKKLADKDLTNERRLAIQTRISELASELPDRK